MRRALEKPSVQAIRHRRRPRVIWEDTVKRESGGDMRRGAELKDVQKENVPAIMGPLAEDKKILAQQGTPFIIPGPSKNKTKNQCGIPLI